MTLYRLSSILLDMNTDQTDVVANEMLLAFWKIHILHHAESEPVYGLWMMEELRRHGHRISPGTLYPLLRRMETYGWLLSQGGSDAPRRDRKCYRLTKQGAEVLALLRAQVIELYREVVEEAPKGGGERRKNS